jgi:RNA polymerase sigma-70 factor (ECF subfamily)
MTPMFYAIEPPLWPGMALARSLHSRERLGSAPAHGGYDKARAAVSLARATPDRERRARFESLCESLRPDLFRFAFWLARDRALAEDVVQDSMLRAWKAQDSLQDEAAAKGWFLAIIRREYARTFERKRFVTVDVDDLVAREEPMLAAAEGQQLAELRAAIFKLPEEYREPLALQVLMGYSMIEIGQELNLSVPAVLTRLFRARQQLRALCGEDTSLDPQQ